MKIEESPQFRAELLEKIKRREFRERVGTHCSDLIYCLNKQALRKLMPKPDTEHETLLFSLGYASQRWLTGSWEDAEPQEQDGIIVTADSIYGECDDENCLEQGESCPWELKATFQSNTRPIEENIPWIRQIMAQCFVWGVQVAFLSRFELMGNWSWVWNGKAKPDKIKELVEKYGSNWDEHPTLHAYKLTFTVDELNRNWEWLKERRILYEAVLATGKLLPKVIALPSGQDYECSHCKYMEVCNGGSAADTPTVGADPVADKGKE